MANYLFIFFLVMVIAGLRRVEGQEDINGGCNASSCSEIGPIIRFPFRLKDKQPNHCGYPGFELSCDHMNRTILQLPVHLDVEVVYIDYSYQIIGVRDPQNCFPALLLSHGIILPPFEVRYNYYSDYALFNCSPAERNTSVLVQCLSGSGYQVYAADQYDSIYELTSCVKIRNLLSVPFSIFEKYSLDLGSLRWTWTRPDCQICEEKGKSCWSESDCLKFTNTGGKSSRRHLTTATKKRLFLVLGAILLIPALVALYFIYNSLKRMKEDQVKVQRFLKDYKAFKPSRYSYYDIKKITNNFKEKLGVGAYGTVYKGKLSNEIFVAVKLLQSSLENGAEFIKEVGTMATIHHANVVRLVGFCADGVKHALIYEFCANESLEKVLFSENSNFFGWERLQEIALGIASGIEYLHHGCDSQILHFDIKPHNILLDHNFNPKITDFGLAKLCPKDQSKVSMTKARGTMGYIAPEVFSRNFGNVSNKSDVFSFGMLLLEMVGGRKNVDSTAVNSNRTYFPQIIYDRICRGEDIDEESEIAKKIAIVGLWCIQWSPPDRPSMKIAVQMLEAKVEMLPIPPNPFASIDGINKHAKKFNTELDVISEVYLLNGHEI